MTAVLEVVERCVADVQEARSALDDATSHLGDSMTVRRACDAVERNMREVVEQAEREARREISKCIRVEGTKSFIVDQADGTEHQVSAPERDRWLDDSVRIAPEVVDARRALREAEEDRVRGSDGLVLAERQYSAAKADLAAAVAVLNAITGTETR